MHEIDHKVYPTPPLTYNLYMSHAKLTTITTLLIIILLLQASLLPSSLFLLLSASLFKTLTMMRNGDEHHQQYSSLEVEGESSDARNVKGKTPIMETPFIGKVVREAGHDAGSRGRAAIGRGIALVDFVIRLIVLAALLAATILMGTTNETLPFFTQFFQFQARYYDLPSFTYFVIANAVSATYVVLSLPFSIVTIVRPSAKAPRLVLLTSDAIAATLTTSAAAAAAAIVYLAHKGNTNTNWIAICQQFGNFCKRSSGSVVASFIAAFLFMLLVILSAVALKTN